MTGLRSARLLLALTILTLLVLTRSVVSPRPALAMSLGEPRATCNGSTATVSFDWTIPASATQVWLDLSLSDNNFAPGTFVSAGPLSANASSYVWSGLLSGLVHYWRINALTPSGWTPSATGAFVPCGNPVLLYGPTTCTGPVTAMVDFRWAPIADQSAKQWIDIGSDPNFAPGTFTGIGPIFSADQTRRWTGIAADANYFFRVNESGSDGRWHTSQVAGFSVHCSSNSGDIYGSADRLVMPRSGVNAPVNVRDVGWDGVLGVPVGANDVVRYNFLFPGLGGYPGNGGTTMIAGHVDYICCLAVFSVLRNIQNGDEIDYMRSDGTEVTYSVDWFADLPPDYDWNSLAATTGKESMVLITCNGVFDSSTRQYLSRRVVHAVRTN